MKILSEIVNSVQVLNSIGNIEIVVTSIEFDSRKVTRQSLFIAVKGTISDGHQYIDKAIENGAIAIVCETLPEKINNQITYVLVENSEKALGLISSAFYNKPSSKLKLVGVTGTNGKTTTATLLYNLVKKLGFKAGLLSTVRNYIDDSAIEATHTTPDAVQINKLLNKMVEAGCEYCFMEVSSHAIDQERVAGLHFAGGLFTNITHDHLDYHKTFAEYIKAKKKFFDGLSSGSFALVNDDDKNGKVMVQNTKAKVKTFAVLTSADFKARIIESHFEGSMLNIDNADVWTYFVGKFNASNLLCVYATAVLLGFEKNDVLTALSELKPVEGRFETIRSQNGITAIIDYAHTPDALQNVLNAINQIRKDNQQLITVVGAGGDRDKTKRPEMARIAVNNCDILILTSDNPRSEEPDSILEDMKTGIDNENRKKMLAIIDRKEAIRTACLLAKIGDIILIAGKGHETYQEIKGVKHHFDDREITKQILNELYN
ncbi:MAG: UDP-N-acetylmuramoyl-L-alanyl-D-glutamate--2,6-diaminopimelate ligase [Bacteroidetes bacterium GWC2_33_15]|nr:MAG: UDP-N-acetylmuramoyl-L-alanyl-D-glutamate--2,6-diaminopimelate ligase [Bacteroidetes bacterium GWA2_33_15]OFX51252.1 MAG: UDP-N-acetylmuramoyl-L-alanyl-D-glutamate--2,6-diaminopimelate ligase [Bacteroidetes bacterium GWC2_33_15]OFX66362.1 MAG: UDP-N-acetylmuramoyl-L-alanyl-D-glutamate--2,6-diaminopimelate ligase [Bacteroidetes bacterium GWB2_32_14]OFX70655.1 MAG: UDP-N-acetylmuramoyl-L-alanyl-D-glutamate--2,6-diaminopimelate ligase [Bacteroidetes bacterium GWD2_33_33]HAN18755.1 UDP-N-ac